MKRLVLTEDRWGVVHVAYPIVRPSRTTWHLDCCFEPVIFARPLRTHAITCVWCVVLETLAPREDAP